MYVRPPRAFSRIALRPTLAMGLLLALSACRTPMSNSTGEDEVLAVIRLRGSAAVMVALIDPVAPADPTDSAATRAAVRLLQDDVLRSVDASDFTLRVRFESVAAFAGTIHSERGFRRLKDHPSVRRVSLEIGGGGQ